MFWTEEEIKIRNAMAENFAFGIGNILREMNKAFQIVQIEAPILTPRPLVNQNYTSGDIFIPAILAHNDVPVFDNLAFRPETTMGSYQYAQHAITHQQLKLPVCVWQHGKAFRREQDSPSKKVKLKEFYQQEFQCIYGLTTMADYSATVFPFVQEMISRWIGPCVLEDSDRLPSYSERTVDVVSDGLEVCSMSIRNDFPNAKVLEVAIGTDRCVYRFFNRS